ncbi:MAG: hypothetical protein A2Y98_01345 [Candidatus Portnoybacteria bacterium RBG_19FT_COMBO_36_7]|uniref:TrbL/VirB6 plasmid conjugal transfer protein n=1 Tax=Candidatus Portnoybacteria bacterium RBG_19FT_COMBO_36_7 TaxID=1801992 RepID=A0A1G2F703_9BACT|nr:MAG: hypothetical protein A2Y98_01345 [Candidatus Portnoybacteria bacterium RBG_19FT_COMBO_36_7]
MSAFFVFIPTQTKAQDDGGSTTPQLDEYGQPIPEKTFEQTTGTTPEAAKAAGTEAGKKAKANGGLWSWIGNMTFKVVFKLIDGILQVVLTIFGWILYLAAAFLDFVLNSNQLNKFTNAEIVKVGWKISRDTANMFFALILLIISFATILRIESYGIKQVLPRLIIAALLINFSLTIAGVIVDFSQVLTKHFINMGVSGTNGQSIGTTLADKMKVTQGVLRNAEESGAPPINEGLDALAAAAIGLFAGIIVILIAAFTIFAAAIFLMIRYIALLFLLILAPLAWFFYIVPATRNYWSMWWSTFLKWVFFAPAYAFFLYLSLEIIKSDLMKNIGVDSNTVAAAKGFGRYTLPTIVNFIVIIGFLLGSLIVAQKLGVMGAGAAMSMVKRSGKSVGKFAARKGTGYDKWAPAATRLSGATLAKIPGFKNLGKSLQGRAIQMKEKRLETPQNKALQKYYNSLSPSDQLAEMNRANGQAKLIATQAAQSSGALNTASTADLKTAANTFRQFGKDKEARDLENKRPEISVNVDSAIKKISEEGNLNSIHAQSLDNHEVVEAIVKYNGPAAIEALRNKSKQHEDKLVPTLEKLAKTHPTDDKIQFAYASQSGDVSRMTTAQKEEWASKAGPAGLSRMKITNVLDIAPIAANIPPNTLRKIVQEMKDPTTIKMIVNHVISNTSTKANKAASADPFIANQI